MAIRLGLVLLLLAMAMAMVAESSPSSLRDVHWDLLGHGVSGDGGLVGDSIDPNEEMMMESDSVRRSLRGDPNYISYEALKKNNVPCSRRGAPYYNWFDQTSGGDKKGRENKYIS